MESTECIAAHVTARTILLHSATITVATSSRTADSTPAGVSRSVAVLVMGLLNQPPPTVPGCSDPVVHNGIQGVSEVVRRGLQGTSHPPARRADLEFPDRRRPSEAAPP